MELPWQLHPYHLLAAFIFMFRSFCWMMKKRMVIAMIDHDMIEDCSKRLPLIQLISL
ncbi:hypothetical protein RCO48_12905 [Peribacillus frigoritolerans]|nr:hypothetical protein [Peribacillus frigoritolerans]